MNKMNLLKKFSLLLLLTLLVAAVTVGCGEPQNAVTTDAVVVTVAPEAESVGEGQYTFSFTATFLDGSAKHYNVSTDCTTVGDALLALELIDGEAGPFGLYVKSVCGVVADYDVNQTYWALYTNGESSMVGVDAVKCADVTSVEFRVSR